MIPARLNLAAHLLDARLAEGRGDRPAIRTATGVLSYREVQRLSARYAHLLAADDIRPEERVIIALPDGPEFVAALFGILRRGSVVVMINPDAPLDLTQYFFEYTRATAAFIRPDRAAVVEEACAALPRAPRLYAVGDEAFSERVRSQPDDLTPFDSHRDDAAIWL